MPILTIIAGPNGAGKSTHSKELLSDSGIEAFDFDREFYSIWSRFGFDPLIEQGAFSQAQELYLERRTSALQSNLNFAFESNYHTIDVLNIVEMFKSRGYRTELVFIYLDSPELAIERVRLRVAKGGHSVAESTIRSRFDAGLKLLDETFDQYDLVTIYTSMQNEVSLSYVVDSETNTIASIGVIPESMKRRLPNLSGFSSHNG